jgi:hypothetical protein
MPSRFQRYSYLHGFRDGARDGRDPSGRFQFVVVQVQVSNIVVEEVPICVAPVPISSGLRGHVVVYPEVEGYRAVV